MDDTQRPFASLTGNRPAAPQRTLAVTIMGIAIVAGACLASWPLLTSGALVAIALGSVLVRSPRPLVAGFLSFLVFQDPLIFFSGGETSPLGLMVKRTDEFLLLFYAAGVLMLSRAARLPFRNQYLTISIVGCYLGVIVSSLVRPTDFVPAAIDLVLFSKPFLLLAIGASLAPSEGDIRRMLAPGLFSMLAVVGFAIVFLLFPQWQDAYIGAFRAPDQRMGVLSAQGFFDGPGPYSWFCVATFALAYAAYLCYERRFFAVAAVTSATFVLLSWRRKSIAGVIAILFVALLLRDKGPRRRLRAVAAMALAIAFAATIIAPYVEQMFSYTAQEFRRGDETSNARIALHYTSLLIARDNFPLGTGLASFGSHASRLYYSDVYRDYGLSQIWGLSPQYPSFICDTFWPMVLGEGGAVSFFSYLAFMLLLGSTAWQAARSTENSNERRFFTSFVLFVFVGSLLESTSSQIYGSSMQSSLVMIPMGALLAMIQRRQDVIARRL